MMSEIGIGSRERKVLEQAKWDMLRSDIYIRDKGMCWVCNEKAELKDYDLGHLIDRCNGGQDEDDNLAVMHKRCNIKKPRHTSLEEAMEWRLSKESVSGTPVIKPLPNEQLSSIATSISKIRELTTLSQNRILLNEPVGRGNGVHKLHLTKQDGQSAKELVIEYFENKPLLLMGDLNHARSEAIRQLSASLNTPIPYIRRWMVEAGFVKPRPMATDGSQYHYVYNNLADLVAKYNRLPKPNLLERPKLMGITNYQIDIMFYLINMPDKVSRKNLPKIRKRVAQLGIPIQFIS